MRIRRGEVNATTTHQQPAVNPFEFTAGLLVYEKGHKRGVRLRLAFYDRI